MTDVPEMSLRDTTVVSGHLDELKKAFVKNADKSLFIDRENIYSYREVWSASRSIVKQWSKLGMCPGDRIGFSQENSISFLISILACVVGGFVGVFINPNQSDERIRGLLSITKPKQVLDEPVTLTQRSFSEPVDLEDIKASDENDFCILYSSGTTGEPKGICHRLGGLLGSARAFATLSGMGGQTRLYHVLPMYYMAGFLNSFLAPLFAGSTVVIGRSFSSKTVFDFWRDCETYRVNTLSITPTIAAALCRAARHVKAPKATLDRLVSVQTTAGVLHSGLRRAFVEAFGHSLQDCYGMTELGGPLTIQTPRDAKESEDVGHAMPALQFSFRDIAGGAISGQEMWIRSPYVMRGYISLGGLDLPVDRGGFMATGDVARFSGGKLKITGRLKDVIIRGSENIYPLEIENIASIIPGVKEVSVVGVYDAFWGERVVGCLIREDFEEEDMLLSLVSSVASEKLNQGQRPDHWIMMEDFPRTAIGKVDKKALSEIAENKLRV
ncbi:acyl--CoA ligase [Gammaproteobacteria bacterium]|nr:acyl--CoA ligase [Gammaproteobacteria bacterium]